MWPLTTTFREPSLPLARKSRKHVTANGLLSRQDTPTIHDSARDGHRLHVITRSTDATGLDRNIMKQWRGVVFGCVFSSSLVHFFFFRTNAHPYILVYSYVGIKNLKKLLFFRHRGVVQGCWRWWEIEQKVLHRYISHASSSVISVKLSSVRALHKDTHGRRTPEHQPCGDQRRAYKRDRSLRERPKVKEQKPTTASMNGKRKLRYLYMGDKT